jgi:tetratricopeptide (TPR) repeat protein
MCVLIALVSGDRSIRLGVFPEFPRVGAFLFAASLFSVKSPRHCLRARIAADRLGLDRTAERGVPKSHSGRNIMIDTAAPSPASGRLERLLGFLGADPSNEQLLADAAGAALDARQPAAAAEILDRHARPDELPPHLLNLRALAALQQGEAAEAVELFEALRATGGDAPPVRFNLASAHVLLGDHSAALDLLDPEVVAAVRPAALLRIHTLHRLDRPELALEEGEGLAAARPDDTALMGALASAAIDDERPELARRYALAGGSDPEAVAALGLLELNDHRPQESIPLFDSVLARDPNNARASIGKGMALLATGDTHGSLEHIDRGAEAFVDHPGSWIASGWAYYLAGDLAASRARFERALACDDNFAESHGALAVLDIAAGDHEEARRRLKVALRLDRNCFSAALASSMLLRAEGKDADADKVIGRAMHTPLGEDGYTVAQALAAGGAYAGKRPRN